jgi:hypothetical protein
VVLTILASGIAQYYLAHVLGLGAPARVLAALIYMMNGQMIARFGFGHFDFGLAYPYIPLTFAFLIRAMQAERGVKYPLLAGASLAGLLFAGNVYYLFFAIPGLIAAVILYGVTLSHGTVAVQRSVFGRAFVSGLWAIGLSAIQWVPWVETRNLIFKDADPLLLSSLTVTGSVRTLFESDRAAFATGAFGMIPGFLHEYYAYVGIFLVPALLLSPLALLTGKAREWLLCGLMLTLYVLLASAAHTPVKHIYEAFPKLYDFRWPSREMALAMPFVPLLAGLGLESAWETLRRLNARFRLLGQKDWVPASAVGLAAAVLFTYVAVRDVFEANQSLYHFSPAVPVHAQVARWLESDQDRPFLFDHFDGSGGSHWSTSKMV